MWGVPVKLTDEQNEVVGSILEWYREMKEPYITVGGYAGTGKTTILGAVRELLGKEKVVKRVAFCAFTGKAASVLRQRLRDHKALKRGDYCGTIHGLIYEAVLDEMGMVASFKRIQSIPHDLIVVDEASMVGGPLWDDLCAFDVPIVAIGDHGQLPPLEGTLNLVAEPRLRLETIHRQAEGNPIIKVSLLARKDGVIPEGVYGPGVEKIPKDQDATRERLESEFASFNAETMILCGYNRTRVALNKHVREKLGFLGPELMQGERVICLRNNWSARQHPVFNGMLGEVLNIEPEMDQGVVHWYNVIFQMDGEERLYTGQISAHQIDNLKTVQEVDGLLPMEIGDRFDRGYALTVHKAQGSQARKVILFEQKSKLWSGDAYRRWLYTAVTRAREELLIVG